MTRHAIPVALALVLGACASVPDSVGVRVPQSPLEMRQAQSRTFETADPRLVLKAALNVLQDQGSVIRQADAELGIVTAVMEWRSRQPNRGLRVLKWVTVVPTYGASLLIPSGRTEVSAIEANVNVTPDGAKTRVRISLVSRVTGKGGEVLRVLPVDDPLAYQRLLVGLDKAVFLEHEGL
jgi:ribosomal protein S12